MTLSQRKVSEVEVAEKVRHNLSLNSIEAKLSPVTHSTKYRADIDGLRAIAILSVLIFHATSLLPGGFIGVDVFFVISGYLITGSIHNDLKLDRFTFVDFYTRRVRRIFPALIIVLFVAFALGWLLFPPDFKLVGKHIAGGAGFISNLISWREAGYFDAAALEKPLLHLWSLGIEEQFYFIWPVLLLVMWKWQRKLVPVVVLLLTVSFACNVYFAQANSTLAFYSPITRFWELMAGSLLACFPDADQKLAKRSSNVVSWAGLATIVLGLALINESRQFPGWWAVLPTLGAVLLILGGENSFVNRVFLSHPIMRWFGLISYPLYLWHWVLLSYLKKYEMPFSRLNRYSVVVASIILAWLTYEFIEKRIRFGTRKRLHVQALAFAMIAVFGLGLATYWTDGFAARIDEKYSAMIMAEYDYRKDFRNAKCLLSGDEKEFSTECVELGTYRQGKPLVLIWGDSHGAHIFRAIEAKHAEFQFALAQFTSSSCPPILDFVKNNRPLCKPLNDYVAEQIKTLRPNTVILAHDWPQSTAEKALDGLAKTVNFLRENGAVNIVLVGPVPHWTPTLQTVLMRRLMISHSLTAEDFRIKDGLVPEIEDLDVDLRSLAEANRVNYVSPYRALCDDVGCLAVMSAPHEVLTSFDNAHLTPEASKFVVEEAKTQIFKTIPLRRDLSSSYPNEK